MSSKSVNTFAKSFPYGVMFFAALILGIILIVANISQIQSVTQHASVNTFTSIAVQGSIYSDTNDNGKKDNNEQNYTGTPQAHVVLALFSSVCPQPTPNTTVTPLPTAPPGCYYRKFCPMIACRPDFCPPCKSTLVCITPGTQNNQGSQGSGDNVTYQGTFGQINKINQGNQINLTNSRNGENQDLQAAQQADTCMRHPLKLINCPVGGDGNYECVSQGTTFLDAWVWALPPAKFKISSKNPVSVTAPTAHVDFGLFHL